MDFLNINSGQFWSFVLPAYETRIIYLAQGIEYHNEDLKRICQTQFDYLRGKFGRRFKIESDKVGKYTSNKQKVHFIIKIIQSKDEFKKAVETEGVHVIYSGHSRYGRGACFDNYTGTFSGRGEQFGQGTNNKNGLYRMGYPYVPVPINDIRSHYYHFAPIPVENGAPSKNTSHPYNFHPDARRYRFREINLPADLQCLVVPFYKSATNRYYGIRRRGKYHLLLHAGWEKTRSDPYDLGATNIKCKVFCHFGCSSRKHFLQIVRNPSYKGWVRPKTPTDKYAYFTTDSTDEWIDMFWLYYLFKFNKKNNFQPWWESLEYAKRRTNRKLRREFLGYQIF